MSVLSHLQSLSSALNIADNEAGAIERSIATLDSRLVRYYGTSAQERFRFGSSVRKTMLPRQADAYSDVDYMIVFDNSSNYKPQSFISGLKRFAETYYTRSEIYQSTPTVVLSLGHISFDLVPAYRSWNSIHIPAPKSSYVDWMPTDPSSFNNEVNTVNNRTKFQIKPVIRLLKYWNAKNGYIYESYSLEQTVVRMGFYFQTGLKELLFTAVGGLPTWNLPQGKQQKVVRAQQLVSNTRHYEQQGLLASAENEIKKLLPSLA